MQTFTDPDFRQKPYEYASNEYGEEYDEIDDCMDYTHEFTINDLITTIQIVFDFSIIQMDFRPEQFGRITIKI